MIFKTYAEEIRDMKEVARGFPKGVGRVWAKRFVKDHKLKLLGEQRESVLKILQVRFDKVPKRIQRRVSKVDKFPLLDDLYEVAVLCDTLKKFEKRLPAS